MWPPSQWLIGKIILIWFSSFLGQTKWHFLFWVYTEDPEMDPESSGQWYIPYNSYFFSFSCYLFIRNTSISFFGHLPWTLKTLPNNTDHCSYFFLIFCLFYSYFSSRNANISIFGNAHWTLKTVSHGFPYLEMHTGPWNQTNSEHHPYFFSAIFHL